MGHTIMQQAFKTCRCCHGSCGLLSQLESTVVCWSKFSACAWSLRPYNWSPPNLSKGTTTTQNSQLCVPATQPHLYTPNVLTPSQNDDSSSSLSLKHLFHLLPNTSPSKAPSTTRPLCLLHTCTTTITHNQLSPPCVSSSVPGSFNELSHFIRTAAL